MRDMDLVSHRRQIAVHAGSLAAFSAVLVSCATRGPVLRADYDPTADYASYLTYGFASELGTDRGGYSTLVTGHFKRAVSREMEARGYRLADSDPDLIVNFFADVRHEADVVSADPTLEYYGYRRGLYTAWPFYEVRTIRYQVGTANVDVVDAARAQLIWEGVAEGRLTDDIIDNPGPAISSVVGELFERYPARAGAPIDVVLEDLGRPG